MEENKTLEHTSMYELFAKMFAHLTKEVTEKFGEEGEQAIRAGVRAFGEERGRDIANRAKANGKPNDAYNYLPSYDMARSDDFTAEETYGDNQVKQLFSQCVFADQWMADDTQKYGILYCEEIDPAIASGYNKNFKCIHDRHIFTHGVCDFCFKMEQGE